MPIELKIPEMGESITEVEIGRWLKNKGDFVRKDEPVVTLESEKATVELPVPETGTLIQILKLNSDVAKVGETIAWIDPQAQPAQAQTPPPTRIEQGVPQTKPEGQTGEQRRMPAAQAAVAEHSLHPEEVHGSGTGARPPKQDVAPRVERIGQEPHTPAAGESPPVPEHKPDPAAREEEIVPMSRLRRTVAERLVEAQRNAALLTTFNEIDMGGVIALREEYGGQFQQKYQVKLGFMSFFVKACIDGLKQFPALNAAIHDTNIIYHNYYDIGVAVGGGKGLVVPVLRNAERLSFAEVELAIADFARRARENILKVDDLQGGTFTISNGGVYGSLLSTPLVNPPQSGILGLHAIQERPVAQHGAVVIRPMMYVALTYDHRLVDGREAVSFLKRVKEVIQTPARMLMEV
jgi:2-oxoglutarate dehydrogenase E2 component (dihydrolipoamide succinyltransferase)